MSAIDTKSPQRHHHCNRPPSKRKLEDFKRDHFSGDCAATHLSRLRRNSPDSKGKSVVFDAQFSDLLRGDSSGGSDFGGYQVRYFVRMLSDNKHLCLESNLTDTIEMVHKQIYYFSGIPVREQRLIYRGKQLDPDKTLEEYSIKKDAGLQLVSRMKSTLYPLAWQVIDEMVFNIKRVCRGESRIFISRSVKESLEHYMNIPAENYKHHPPSCLVYNKDGSYKMKSRKKEFITHGFYNNFNVFDKADYCKIFMDAYGPQALVMLYMSSDKENQDCADYCIRCFVKFVKELEGNENEKSYYATIVLEFCRLLNKTGDSNNSLFLHCRNILGSMVENVVLRGGRKEVESSFNGDTPCIAIQDVLPFLKDLECQLVRGLESSIESDISFPTLPVDVSDFSAFLQPVVGFVQMELTFAATTAEANEGYGPLGEEIRSLFDLFTELLARIDKCLKKMDLCLSINCKREKSAFPNRLVWSVYLPILKGLRSISVLYPGADEKFWHMMKQYRVAVCGLVVKHAKRTDDNSWLLMHKDILDFEARRHLAMLMFPEVRDEYEELHEMLIDRSQLLSDSFEYISGAQPSSLHAGLFMEFKDEEATGPGVLREWFCLVCQAIFDPQRALFVACPSDRRRFFPSPASKIDPLHLRYLQFSGRVVALALMHNIQVGISLDRVFLLQLADKHVSIEDIRDADPCIYNSCKQILEMDADFVDSDGLGLTFVIEVEELGLRKVVELCPGGKEIAVNSKNREEYINLIVQHHFVTAIREQVSSFARGFSDILCHSRLRKNFFQSLELEDVDWMLHGCGSDICVEDWKAHTDYHGFKKSDPQIFWFWEVVAQLNAEQKRTLLSFWTSVKYLPFEGFSALSSRLFLYKSMVPDDHLPTSHTCFFRLCIPEYSSKAVLQDRLLWITQTNVACGFGTW